MGFIISSDSCCDSFKSYLKAKNAFYLPMSYIIKDIPYFDDFDSAEQYRNFYDGLRSGKMPKTAQANTFETAEYFEKLLKENDGDIVHLALSSGLSNTAINSEAAAEEVMQKYPSRKVYAIDSLSATQGQMYLVDRALEMRDTGMSAAQAAEELKLIACRLHHFVLVKDLFHLKRGGRVSSAAAMIGTMLNIRPILIINHKGQLVVIHKEKGVTKSLKYLTKALIKNIREGEICAYIAHADDIDTAEGLKGMLIDEGITDVKIGFIGPVIGSHTGPGAIGLVFEGEKRFTIEQKK